MNTILRFHNLATILIANFLIFAQSLRHIDKIYQASLNLPDSKKFYCVNLQIRRIYILIISIIHLLK